MMKKLRTPETGLYTAEIRLTKACNLSCKHCSVKAGRKEKDELKTEEIANLIDQISRMGALYVVFTGGEPLLQKDLPFLVETAISEGLRVSIDTNGTLLTMKNARALKKAGVSTIQVSIDGVKETHESIRGQGTFEKTLEGISHALNEGIYTTLNFTVSRLNQDDLPEVIKLSKNQGVNALTMERFTPIGRGKEIEDFHQDPQEFKKSLEVLLAAEGIKTNSTDPLAVFLKDKIIASYSKEALKERIYGGCTAGVAALTISYDGEVYPCPKLEISCGNIRASSLQDIWENSGVLKTIRFRRFKGRCGGCEWKNLCGGCRAVAQAVNGDYLSDDSTCFIEIGV
jgi:radical SAM protein with 4Fe4S-binding SPASM domain